MIATAVAPSAAMRPQSQAEALQSNPAEKALGAIMLPAWPRATTEAPPVTETDRDVESLQRTLTRLLPPYKVLLHNDDYNSMGHVVHALRRVIPGMSRAEALHIMFQAHTDGVAVVVVCPKEPAEHYRDGLRSYGLTSTIEPDV